MITLILGENSFEVERQLGKLVANFDGEIERIDGAELSVNQLPDILSGVTLFTSARLIVLKNTASNSPVWAALGVWCEKGFENNVVLIERAIDKRTKAYKIVSKHANVIAADQLTERDWKRAEEWLDQYAHAHKVKLSRQQIHEMVQRAYVPDNKPGRQLIDQQVMATAVQALMGLESVDDAAIATVMPQTSHGTVFDILNYALSGERDKVHELMLQLRRQDEALAVYPSLMSQWTQLVQIALVGERGAEELGIHPYVAQKLSQLARGLKRDQLKQITSLGARLDADMKRSAVEPWDAVDRFVLALTVGK